MEVVIRGENVEVTEAISGFAEEKIERIAKFFKDEEVEANILLKILKVGQKAEITINYKKIVFRSEEIQDDIYAAIDVAVDKLERQIKKNKSRLQTINRGTKQSKKEFLKMSNELEKEENKLEIIKKKNLEVGPMSDEEALLQIDLIDHDFFIYKDVDDNHVKILYKRRDNKYGLINVE